MSLVFKNVSCLRKTYFKWRRREGDKLIKRNRTRSKGAENKDLGQIM
jgi:hypothetical protein